MKIWLITDTHLGHEKMVDYCGRPANFTHLILQNLSVVQENDILIHLGDICIGMDAHWHEMLSANVKGRKWLVRGNHDNKSDAWYLEHGWDFVCSKFQGRFNGKNIMFSHAPQHFEEIVETQFGAGSFDLNIHGHFHNTLHRLQEGKYVVEGEKERNAVDLANITPRHKLLAVEYTDYKPVSLDDFL